MAYISSQISASQQKSEHLNYYAIRLAVGDVCLRSGYLGEFSMIIAMAYQVRFLTPSSSNFPIGRHKFIYNK